MAHLTKRLIDSLKPRENDYFVWDEGLKRFGVRVWPSGERVFVVQYRVNKRLKRLKIGSYGALTAEEARKLAMVALGDVARGEDPQAERKSQRKTLTVGQLCDTYLRDAERGAILGKYGEPKKASTLSTDRGRIERHIKPLLGSILVIDLTLPDISKFIRDVTAGKTAVVEKTQKLRGKAIVEGGAGTASRTVGLLGGILSYAVSEGIIERNPASGVKRPPSRRTKRRLSPMEYATLGSVLREAERDGAANQGINAIRVLALTGCRRGEIEGLQWDEVKEDLRELRLTHTKEGQSVRPLGKAALTVLGLLRAENSGGFVFISPQGKHRKFGGLPGVWDRVAGRAGFVDVTMHTLRHSYASVAADLGYVETTIAALLGHSSKSMTSSYVHHLDTVLIAAADRVSIAVQQMMNGATFTEAADGKPAPNSRDQDTKT